jgi:hypothetical protein
LTFLVLVMSARLPASAQAPADLGQAKKWFKEAETAERKGDCKAAVELFRKALAVKETPQLYLRIGNCQEKLGDLVAAQGSYERSLERATQQNLGDVADVAREELEDLRPRVPTVSFTIKDTPRDLALKLDGLPLATSSVNTPLLLNPGDHTVSAEARGRGVFTKTFTLTEKERATVAIELPEGSGEQDASPAVTSAPTAAPPPDGPPPDQTGPNIPVIALLAGGGAAVVGGVVLLAVSFAKDADIDERCGGSDRPSCPSEDKAEIESDVSSVDLFRGLGFGLAGAGLVAGGIGVALLVTAPKKEQPPAAVFVAPSFGTASLGISARGRF